MDSNGKKLVFQIHGMDCAEEVAVLKRALGPLVGGEERLAFDILNAKLAIEVVAGRVSADDIIGAVARTGMRAEPWRAQERDAADHGRHPFDVRSLLTAASGLLTAGGFVVTAWHVRSIVAAFSAEGVGAGGDVPYLATAFYVIAIVTGGWYILPKAWHAVITGRPDMNLLMTIAVIGAAAIGQWFEAATVAFLFALSLVLESWSVGRARRAIAALLDLAPLTARVQDARGQTREVAPAEVAVGTLFVVRPAEKIPLDGVVVRGASDVNQAPITGESEPVETGPGSEVFAGTINGNGVLEIESTRPANDTTLAQIVRMVGQAQSRRAPSEQWVERFARVYTPAVMALASAVFIFPPLFLGGQWLDWLYRALVLLVIACPCALVISTPVSVVAALALAARNGVLIKGGVFVEMPAQLRAVALDKTGTLTQGHPELVDIVPMHGHDESDLLKRAAALESHSNHPLGWAIVAAAHAQGIAIPEVDGFEIIQGKGATGKIEGRLFWIGSHRFLEQRQQETAAVHQQLDAIQQAGRSVVVVGNENHVCGFLALADMVRPAAAETLSRLRHLGVEHIVMLTGDNQGTGTAIGAQAGVDRVYAELLPSDKVTVIESLVDQYRHVAMVGDGVNDAPALARASLGIAMGAAGSDAAIETADIALMSDDLSKLPWLIQHSRRTLAIIRQNITFALAVKAIFVVLTLVGHASLWAAIAADTGASLLVIFNGLRLLTARAE